MKTSELNLADDDLAQVVLALPMRERRAVERHMRGRQTDESWAVVRWLRRKLKRRVRAKRK